MTTTITVIDMQNDDDLNLSQSPEKPIKKTQDPLQSPLQSSSQSQPLPSSTPQRSSILLISLCLTTLAVTAAVIFLDLPIRHTRETEKTARSLYFHFDDPFISNTLSMEEKGSSHYLRIELSLLTDNPAVLKVLKDNQPLLRNELQMLFSEQVFENLKRPGAYEKLREDVELRIEKLLKTLETQNIKKVLFTQVILE